MTEKNTGLAQQTIKVLSHSAHNQRDAYVRAIRRKAERHLDDFDNAKLWDQAYTAIPEPRKIFLSIFGGK